MSRVFTNSWPKSLPDLTDEQQRIRNDFFQVWLEALPQRYGLIERFNHTYPLHSIQPGFTRTLDIGAGRGEHLAYERLDQQQYIALELREELADRIRTTYPQVSVLVGDIQQGLELAAGYFTRILAIHVLEHLPDLPAALAEIKRLLDPHGLFSVLIPCDPGLAYELARTVSARRIFERRYRQSYDWFIACEHINSPREILGCLDDHFEIMHRRFFPLHIPLVNVNLVIGLTLRPRA